MQQLPSGIVLADMGSPLNQGRTLALYGLADYVRSFGWVDAIDGVLARKVLGTAGSANREYPIPGLWPDLLAPYCQATSTEHYSIPNFNYPKGPITLMAWIYPNSATGGMAVAGDYTASGAASAMIYVFSNRLQVYITTTGSGSVNVNDGGPITLNAWNHIAMTWDGSTLTAYANGAFKAGGSTAATGTSILPTQFNLGFANGANVPFPGYWGDVGVWNRCLTLNEIQNYIAATRYGHEAMTYQMPRPRDLSAAVVATPVSGYAMGMDNAAALFAASSRRRNVVYSLPPSWSIDPSLTRENVTLDKFHTPLAVASPRPRPNLYAQVRGEFGDIPRPIFIDPFPGEAPPWHTPLTQPPRPKEKDRRLLMPFGTLGDIPRFEGITLDKWYAETRIPLRRRPETPPHADSAIDAARLLDKEAVTLDKWYAPIGRILPGRARQLYVPDSTIFQDEVFPQDPVAINDAPWYVAMSIAARRVRTRDRREFNPDGTILLGVPGQILENVLLDFHTPMQSVPLASYRRRTPPLPTGGIDLDAPQRLEKVFEDAFREMGPPRWNTRPSAPFWAATLAADTSTVVEQPHVEAFMETPVLPTAVRRFLTAAWDYDQGALLLSANFAPPLIPRIRRWMLAAGFWRARY